MALRNLTPFLASLMITTSCGTAEPATTTAVTTSTTKPPASFEVIEDLPYASSGNALDVWVPEEASGNPMVVILHGQAGSRQGYDPIAEALVSQGVVVMNASWQSTFPTREGTAGAACAIRFARANAADFGGAPDQIVILGHSAGGAVGAAISLAGDEFDDSDCVASDVSALPKGFVGVAGSYDPALAPMDARRGLEASDPELYALLNPMTHLGMNPTLGIRLLHGDIDDVIPVESATEFHENLLEAGYDVTLTVLEGVGHNSVVAPAYPAFEVTIQEALSAAGLAG